MIGFTEVYLTNSTYQGTAQEIYNQVSITCQKVDSEQIAKLPEETRIIHFKMLQPNTAYAVAHTTVSGTMFKLNN